MWYHPKQQAKGPADGPLANVPIASVDAYRTLRILKPNVLSAAESRAK